MATLDYKLRKTTAEIAKSGSKKRTQRDKAVWKDKLALKDRVNDLLDRQGVKALKDFEIRGDSGSNYNFDFFVPGQRRSRPNSDTKIDNADYLLSRGMGIVVKDYEGPAKVTNVIQAERAMKDCPEVGKVLVISNTFSGPSANLADRSGVILLSLGEIVSTYKNEGWPI
ncbi:MAG: hypothetical protein ACFFGZ_02675 [Candidatus Thorarchaeota archaeon]